MIKRLKKLYCVICSKYKKFENPKRLYLFKKTLVLSIICSKCKEEDEIYYLMTKIQLKYNKLFV